MSEGEEENEVMRRETQAQMRQKGASAAAYAVAEEISCYEGIYMVTRGWRLAEEMFE